MQPKNNKLSYSFTRTRATQLEKTLLGYTAKFKTQDNLHSVLFIIKLGSVTLLLKNTKRLISLVMLDAYTPPDNVCTQW